MGAPAIFSRLISSSRWTISDQNFHTIFSRADKHDLVGILVKYVPFKRIRANSVAKILIVGCGDIGFAVALELQRQGHWVIGIRRQSMEPGAFPIVAADICDAASLAGLPVDFDAVLFIVAPDSRQAQAYQAVYGLGLDNLLAHFTAAKRKPRWLLVSSTSVYGQNQGEWVDETSPVEPSAITSQWLVKAEQRLMADDSGHCVVRFAGIYGPGREWLLRRAANGEAIQQRPPTYTNRIHREDCVAVLLFLLNKLLTREHLQHCYLACDHDPAPLWDVMNWIADQYGFPVPLALPEAENAPRNKRCSNSRLTDLGYRFLYPSYRDGYQMAANKNSAADSPRI